MRAPLEMELRLDERWQILLIAARGDCREQRVEVPDDGAVLASTLCRTEP